RSPARVSRGRCRAAAGHWRSGRRHRRSPPSSAGSRSAYRGCNTRSRKLGCMVELVSLRKTNEVAAYVRASMDRKGDRWTVETQLRKIRALAEAKDWNVVEVYDDNAVSATKKRRAGTRWAEMLDDARAGRFSMVVAVDMDRLLRSTKDLNTLIDLGLRV